MLETLQQFAQTELGWWVTIIMLAYGAIDLSMGMWWMNHAKPELRAQMPRLTHVAPYLMAVDICLILAGGGLWWLRTAAL